MFQLADALFWVCPKSGCRVYLNFSAFMFRCHIYAQICCCFQNSSSLPSDLCSWACLWWRQSELNVVLTLCWWGRADFLSHTLASNCSTGCLHVRSWLVDLHDCGFGGKNAAEITIQTHSESVSVRDLFIPLNVNTGGGEGGGDYL